MSSGKRKIGRAKRPEIGQPSPDLSLHRGWWVKNYEVKPHPTLPKDMLLLTINAGLPTEKSWGITAQSAHALADALWSHSEDNADQIALFDGTRYPPEIGCAP
jgi:hypothetical protein